MSEGNGELLSCWIPLMDIKMELFKKTYCSIDIEKINLNGTEHFRQIPDMIWKNFLIQKKIIKLDGNHMILDKYLKYAK